MATFTETLIEELDVWEKVIAGNARQIASALLSNQLGPIVITTDVAKTDDGEDESYGIHIDPLWLSDHSN